MTTNLFRTPSLLFEKIYNIYIEDNSPKPKTRTLSKRSKKLNKPESIPPAHSSNLIKDLNSNLGSLNSLKIINSQDEEETTPTRKSKAYIENTLQTLSSPM